MDDKAIEEDAEKNCNETCAVIRGDDDRDTTCSEERARASHEDEAEAQERTRSADRGSEAAGGAQDRRSYSDSGIETCTVAGSCAGVETCSVAGSCPGLETCSGTGTDFETSACARDSCSNAGARHHDDGRTADPNDSAAGHDDNCRARDDDDRRSSDDDNRGASSRSRDNRHHSDNGVDRDHRDDGTATAANFADEKRDPSHHPHRHRRRRADRPLSRLLVTLDINPREMGFVRLDLHDVFGNDHPVVLEIGSGKGRFLISSAIEQPEMNFIGIEKSLHYHRLIRERVAKRALANVRLINHDAFPVLRDMLPDASLADVHIYFPDPWPRKREQKRRIIRAEVLREIARVLAPNGTGIYVTDHREYFEAAAPLIEQVFRAERRIPRPEDPPRTNYEAKYREEGREIYEVRFYNESCASSASIPAPSPPASE